MNKIYVFCILLALAIVPVKSREPIGKKLCLNVESNGSVGKYGNFTFSGRISGHESVPHYGYWVAGFDRTGAYWAESDGVVGDSGDVKFGVSNVTSYPVKFVLLRILTKPAMQKLDDASLAEIGRAHV